MALSLKKITRGGLTGGGTGRIADPLKLKDSSDSKKPEKPEKTAEQLAMEKRQTMALDEEIERSEELFASLARGQLGRASLLSGAPQQATAVKARASSGGAGMTGGGGSLLSGAAQPPARAAAKTPLIGKGLK